MFQRSLLLIGICAFIQCAVAAPVVTSGAGLAAATAARDSFRTLLGGGNVAGANGSFGGVRREINWDGVPDGFSAPNNLPATFFNTNSPRGVVFTTPGTGFQLSATAASGTPVRFGNINATYPATFTAFSAERLFTALGSPVTDVFFFVPGTAIPATVAGFGAIFTDVDTNATNMQFFDSANNPLATVSVGNATDVSFLGVTFNAGERVARVRITSGNVALGANDAPPANDVVVMDDFIYAEPQLVFAAPLPIPALQQVALGLLSVLLLGFTAYAIRRRRATR